MNYKNLLLEAKILINTLQLEVKVLKVKYYHFNKEVLTDNEVIKDIMRGYNSDYTGSYNEWIEETISSNIFNTYDKTLCYLKALSHTDKNIGITKIKAIEKLISKVIYFEKEKVAMFYDKTELKVNNKANLKLLKSIENELNKIKF